MRRHGCPTPGVSDTPSDDATLEGYDVALALGAARGQALGMEDRCRLEPPALQPEDRLPALLTALGELVVLPFPEHEPSLNRRSR